AIGSRLAACVQITEATSVYRWEDGVEKDAEQLLTFKTTAQALPGLRRLIEREHPYDEPEFIVLPIVDGSPRTWAGSATASGRRPTIREECDSVPGRSGRHRSRGLLAWRGDCLCFRFSPSDLCGH